jgi:hypothetical protein
MVDDHRRSPRAARAKAVFRSSARARVQTDWRDGSTVESARVLVLARTSMVTVASSRIHRSSGEMNASCSSDARLKRSACASLNDGRRTACPPLQSTAR